MGGFSRVSENRFVTGSWLKLALPMSVSQRLKYCYRAFAYYTRTDLSLSETKIRCSKIIIPLAPMASLHAKYAPKSKCTTRFNRYM